VQLGARERAQQNLASACLLIIETNRLQSITTAAQKERERYLPSRELASLHRQTRHPTDVRKRGRIVSSASGPDGELVLQTEQDRRLWNQGLIAEEQATARHCLRRNQPGPYQIQAAINAVHSDTPSAAATDWRQIVRLYD
jgi:hypothetical protein